MTYLTGVLRFCKGQNRVYQHIQALSTLVSAIAISSNVLGRGYIVLKSGDHASFECVQFPLKVEVPVYGPIQLALQGKDPDSIDIGISPATPSWVAGPGQTHSGMAAVCLVAVHPVFVEYFEAFRPWVDQNINSDVYRWPAPWNFARVVRNAIVHNCGRVHWDDPSPSKAPISWYALTYSHAANKRPIIGPDLSVGDLVILLIEMNNALDRAGCPH